MYSIYADGKCFYNDTYPMDAYKVSSPSLKMADSAAGSLEMVLPPTNVCYDTLKRMKTTIVVKRYDEEIWEGRIVEDSYNFFNERTVYCEGAMAYFNDTCQPQREYTDVTHSDFLQNVINVHNSKVREDRKIFYDFQNVDPGIISYRATNYEKTMEVLNNYCTDFSCHMRLVRRSVNIGTEEAPNYVTRKFIQFFKGPASTTVQTVEFGKNLLDYSANFNMSELATVVLPLGATKTRASSNNVGKAIDLATVKPYNGDDGYGVAIPLKEMTAINYENQIKRTDEPQPRIVDIPGGYSYYTAVIMVKASTKTDQEDNKNAIYLTSRMHGSLGMYMWFTPDFDPVTQPNGGSYVSGKFSAEELGFTDMIEESIDVPYATDQYAQGFYYLYIGSFGGDIQLRVNLKATATDQMDEYYTAEDALVSTVNLCSNTPTFENGKISVDQGSIGEDIDDEEANKYLRTDGWIRDDEGATFAPGKYTLNVGMNTDKVIQVRVFHHSSMSAYVSYDAWHTVPARFEVPESSTYEYLRIAIRYANSNDAISPEDISSFSIAKGERYGSLYVTASSKNLFNDVLERGAMIDSGDLAGEASTEQNLTRLRSSKLLDILNADGIRVGFTEGEYLLNGSVVKLDDTPEFQARMYRYDFATDAFKSVSEWGTLPFRFTVPENTSEKLRFEFRYVDDSSINVTAISNVMLEQGSKEPSQYEPPNTSLIEYGWIEACITWDDVVSPDELYYRAKTYLASGQFDHMTLDVTALDLATLGVNVGALDVNQYIRVISPPHGLDRYFEITELEIPLAEPENMTFKLGAETEQTLTSINNNVNNDLLKMIDEGPSKSAILKTAKDEADKIIKNGFANSYMTILLEDDDHPSGLGFFKAPVKDEHGQPVIDPDTGEVIYERTNDVPSAYWSDIYGNPTYNDIRSLLVNQEGIAFYGDGMNNEPTIALVNAKGEIVADAIKTGTMFADHIRGGTLGLGHWAVVDPSGSVSYRDAELVLKDSDYDSIIHRVDPDETWSDHMVEMNNSVGIIQQGRASDNFFRQVKMQEGILSGSVYFEPGHEQAGWHTGGEILMGTISTGYNYGIEIRTEGTLYLTPGSIVIKSTQAGSPLQAINDPVEFSVIDKDGVTRTLRLEFTHGLLTGYSTT